MSLEIAMDARQARLLKVVSNVSSTCCICVEALGAKGAPKISRSPLFMLCREVDADQVGITGSSARTMTHNDGVSVTVDSSHVFVHGF